MSASYRSTNWLHRRAVEPVDLARLDHAVDGDLFDPRSPVILSVEFLGRLGLGSFRAGLCTAWPVSEARFLGLLHFGEHGASRDEGSLVEGEGVDDSCVGRIDGLLHLHRLQDEE
jgi:hypothetical protein